MSSQHHKFGYNYCIDYKGKEWNWSIYGWRSIKIFIGRGLIFRLNLIAIMKPIKEMNMEELAAFVCESLEKEGIETVLSGGCCALTTPKI